MAGCGPAVTRLATAVARVGADDQALADEYGVGAGLGVLDEVVRAADAGLGDLDDVVRASRGEPLERAAVDLEASAGRGR